MFNIRFRRIVFALAGLFGLLATPAFADSEVPPARRDAISGKAPQEQDYLEMQVQEAVKRYRHVADLTELQDSVAAAYAKKDPLAFYNAVNAMNERLLEYASSGDMEQKVEGASLLLEQMRRKVITRDHFNAAQKLFEEQLARNTSCSSLQCVYLSYAILGLAFPENYTRPNELPVINTEVPTLTADSKRLATFKALASRNWGTDESGAVIAPALIRATAALGQPKDVDEVVASFVDEQTGMFGRGRNRVFDAPNRLTQKAAMDALAELGPQGQVVLKKYAFNDITFVSRLYANIALAYTPLNETDSKKNKENLQQIYCRADFGLKSDEDMAIHQEIAYAYGRGRAPEYVTSQDSTECLVVVPTAPDRRLVAAEMSDAVMKEVVFQMAFLGMGPIISSGKWAARAEGFVSKVAAPFKRFPTKASWADFAADASKGVRVAKKGKGAAKAAETADEVRDLERGAEMAKKASKAGAGKAAAGARVAKATSAAAKESAARWEAADAFEKAAQASAKRRAALEKVKQARMELAQAQEEVKQARRTQKTITNGNERRRWQEKEWAAKRKAEKAKKSIEAGEKEAERAGFEERGWFDKVRQSQREAEQASGGVKASDRSAAARVATKKADAAARTAQQARADKATAERLARERSAVREKLGAEWDAQKNRAEAAQDKIDELERSINRHGATAEDEKDLARYIARRDEALQKAKPLQEAYERADLDYQVALAAQRDVEIRIAQAEEEIYKNLSAAERAASQARATSTR